MPQYSIAIRHLQKYDKSDLVKNALNMAENIDSSDESTTYIEAISCNDYNRWILVIQEEIESLHNNGTWVWSHFIIMARGT